MNRSKTMGSQVGTVNPWAGATAGAQGYIACSDPEVNFDVAVTTGHVDAEFSMHPAIGSACVVHVVPVSGR